MANLSSTVQTQLNKMNRAAQNAVLGTWLAALWTSVDGMSAASGLKKGVTTVSAAQATANVVNISTGLASVTGWVAQVYRDGVNVTADGVFSAQTGGVLRCADGAATLDLTEGDKIHWFAW
jgi:hypothetical protein